MLPAGKTSASKKIEKPGPVITSRDNQWLKRFRAALAGDAGADDGLVGVEGVRLVEAALDSGLPVAALLVSESGERHLERLRASLTPKVQILRTTDRLFAAIADTQTPQGLAALVRPRPATIEDAIRGVALLVVLLGVQDPGNVGTILRSAEAFGATGVVVCSTGTLGTANPLSPKAVRSSAGSALRLPIVQEKSPEDLLGRLRALGVKSYAAVPDKNALTPWKADWKSPAALWIGNEGAGLPEEIIRAADARVSIPQTPATIQAGINAAMATSVFLYEAMRQRRDSLRLRSGQASRSLS